MSFSTQITDLVGGTIDQTACDQWAADACKEIIHVLPAKLKAKCSTVSTLNNSATTLDVDGSGDILYVTRLSANSGGYQLPCREIPAMYGGLAEDSTDLNYYATANDPVYWVDSSSDVSTLKVKPTPEATQTAIVHHITYPTVDVDDVSVIANFPDEAEYLVVLYVAVKQLHQYMNSKQSDLPSDLTLPVLEVVSESLPTWSAPSDLVVPSVPVVPSISAQVVADFSSAAPTYTKPVMSRTAFTDFSSGLIPTDPGAFTISSVVPTPPSTPSFTTPDVGSTTISSTLVSSLGTPPTYTPPVIAGATEELTVTMTAGDQGSDGDQIDYGDWFEVLGDMIEDNEDLEMASAQLQKISTYLNSYQLAMQNKLNAFNEENVEYQGKLQEGLQQAQINAQKAGNQAQIDATEAQQEASLKLQKENQEYVSTLQKYQAEVGAYSADVSKQVQEYGQKLSQYQLELNTSYQAWAKTESDGLQQYSTDIQNEVSEFNRENAIYQATIQEKIQESQLVDAHEARKLQKYQAEVGTYGAELSANVQKFTQEVAKNRAAFDTSMQKYTSEVQKVVSSNSSSLQKFQAEVSNFSASLQKQTTDYQWYQSQYVALKTDYNQGLQQLINGGLTPPQQGG